MKKLILMFIIATLSSCISGCVSFEEKLVDATIIELEYEMPIYQYKNNQKIVKKEEDIEMTVKYEDLFLEIDITEKEFYKYQINDIIKVELIIVKDKDNKIVNRYLNELD